MIVGALIFSMTCQPSFHLLPALLGSVLPVCTPRTDSLAPAHCQVAGLYPVAFAPPLSSEYVAQVGHPGPSELDSYGVQNGQERRKILDIDNMTTVWAPGEVL